MREKGTHDNERQCPNKKTNEDYYNIKQQQQNSQEEKTNTMIDIYKCRERENVMKKKIYLV